MYIVEEEEALNNNVLNTRHWLLLYGSCDHTADVDPLTFVGGFLRSFFARLV